MLHDTKRGTGIEPVTIRAAIERSTTELPARRTLFTTAQLNKIKQNAFLAHYNKPTHSNTTPIPPTCCTGVLLHRCARALLHRRATASVRYCIGAPHNHTRRTIIRTSARYAHHAACACCNSSRHHTLHTNTSEAREKTWYLRIHLAHPLF